MTVTSACNRISASDAEPGEIDFQTKTQNTNFRNFSAVGQNDGDSFKCHSVGELKTAKACRSDEW
jgi:hypothetical protein